MYKPFNLAHALAGAPVCTNHGLPARIVSHNMGQPHNLAVIVPMGLGITERFMRATNDGDLFITEGVPSACGHLVMAPIAVIDDKPVHVGDELQHRENVHGAWLVGPTTDPAELTNYTWPAPTRICQASNDELQPIGGSYQQGTRCGAGYAQDIAEHAIAHGVKHRYLFTRDAVVAICDGVGMESSMYRQFMAELDAGWVQ